MTNEKRAVVMRVSSSVNPRPRHVGSCSLGPRHIRHQIHRPGATPVPEDRHGYSPEIRRTRGRRIGGAIGVKTSNEDGAVRARQPPPPSLRRIRQEITLPLLLAIVEVGAADRA